MAISSAISASAVGRAIGVQSEFTDLRAGRIAFLPQRVAVFGQGSETVTYSTARREVFSAAEVGEVYGFGSNLHLAAMGLFQSIGNIPVTVYPLNKAAGAVAAAGTITPSGNVTKTAAFTVYVGGFATAQAIANVGETAAQVAAKLSTAINDLYYSPVVATEAAGVVTATAKCLGETGNRIKISVSGPTDAGITFAVVQPTGGTGIADVATALTLMGDTWETLVLNCGLPTTTATLDKFSTANESRWDPEVGTPFLAFNVSTETAVATAYAVSDARKTDRTNVQLNFPGSVSHPCYIAGSALAAIAVIANDNPPQDYGSQLVAGVLPGPAESQWTSSMRDTAVKKGCSTIQVRDGVCYLSDTVSMYHPTGEEPPAYRYVCDQMKVWTIRHNVATEFRKPEWDGAPLIPDSQPTVNPSARKPKSAKAVLWQIIDNLAKEAIISDPEFAKNSVLTGINSSNPKRLDAVFETPLSGNTNIISVTNKFGFYFGG